MLPTWVGEGQSRHSALDDLGHHGCNLVMGGELEDHPISLTVGTVGAYQGGGGKLSLCAVGCSALGQRSILEDCERAHLNTEDAELISRWTRCRHHGAYHAGGAKSFFHLGYYGGLQHN